MVVELEPPPSPKGLAAAEAHEAATRWVRGSLSGLYLESEGSEIASDQFVGGHSAAYQRLSEFDCSGYGSKRGNVYPTTKRGASRLSPYIRHGIITLKEVYLWTEEHCSDFDRDRFRSELLWQEYARHLYFFYGRGLRRPYRYRPKDPVCGTSTAEYFEDEEMLCIKEVRGELVDSGYIVNQSRMWLASHATVRHRKDWLEGEEIFFRHLVDGSRAANRLGWQWVAGYATGRPYGFSQSQVARYAPRLCAKCSLKSTCPIQFWPETYEVVMAEPIARYDHLVKEMEEMVSARVEPSDVAWITAENLGLYQEALRLPRKEVIFIFDEPLLRKLRISSKRLIFIAQTLGEIQEYYSNLRVFRGDPTDLLKDREVDTCYSPVPLWRRYAKSAQLRNVYPYPWLREPKENEPLSSFSKWRSYLERGDRASRRN